MKLLAVIALAAILTSCGSVGMINADNVTSTTTTLTERTDLYILQDASINRDEKIERMSRTASVRTYFVSGGEVPVKLIYPEAMAVLNWHDAYIEADTALAHFERELAEFESKALRGVFDEAMRKVR